MATYPSINAHLEWCRAAGYADNTLRGRLQVLLRVADDLGPNELHDANHLARWLGHDGWSAQTRAGYYAHLSGFFRWEVRTGRQPANPMDLLDRPRVPKRAPRPIPAAVFQRIMASVPDPWRLAALLARYAGLRCCEVARARREDIDPDDLVVLGKGGRLDTIPTHPRLWQAVCDLPPGLLVAGCGGTQLTPGTLSKRFGEIMRRVGLPGVTLHRVRHLYATTLLRDRSRGGAGANLRVVQRLCRHSSVATTEQYTEITDEECRTAIAALPAVA